MEGEPHRPYTTRMLNTCRGIGALVNVCLDPRIQRGAKTNGAMPSNGPTSRISSPRFELLWLRPFAIKTMTSAERDRVRAGPRAATLAFCGLDGLTLLGAASFFWCGPGRPKSRSRACCRSIRCSPRRRPRRPRRLLRRVDHHPEHGRRSPKIDAELGPTDQWFSPGGNDGDHRRNLGLP